MLNEDLVKKLNGISTRLDNLYKVVIDQDKEIKELKTILKSLYENNIEKKKTIERYKEKCGALSSKENTSRNNSRS